MKTRRAFWMGWGTAAAISTVLLGGALLPPFVGETVRQAIMAIYSAVCHQLPGRSPHIDGVQLAACHRCIGIYAALAAAPIGFLFLRRWDSFINGHARFLVPASILVPGADWLADLIGLWSNTPASRFGTGAVFGLTAGYFLCRAFVNLFVQRDDAAVAPPLVGRSAGSN